MYKTNPTTNTIAGDHLQQATKKCAMLEVQCLKMMVSSGEFSRMKTRTSPLYHCAIFLRIFIGFPFRFSEGRIMTAAITRKVVTSSLRTIKHDRCV